MKTWLIRFKNSVSVYVRGNTLPHAIIRSGLRPFLVVDVEYIKQIK